MTFHLRLLRTFWPATEGISPGALWLATAAVAGVCSIALASPAGAAEPPAQAGSDSALPPVTDVQHIIQPGDTLEALSQRYAGDGRVWPALRTLNRVRDPRRLRPGSVLRIPSRLLPAETATVEFTRGAVAVLPPQGAPSKTTLAAGDRLPEGARVQVGPDAFVTLRLADGSFIRVRSDSDVQLQQLRRRGRAGSVQSVLDLHGGGVESTVVPQAQPDRRFDVRTRTATTSVRGTQFSVDLADSGQATTSVDKGSVEVRSAAEWGGKGTPARAASNTPEQAIALEPGQGIAVAMDGQLSSVRPLLPAPDLASLPTSWQDADLVTLSAPPVDGAVAYQLQLARDAGFTEVVRSQRSATPVARWAGLPDGHYYLSVRGVDDAAILGRPAIHSITVKTQPVPPLYQSPAPKGTIDRAQGELRCTGVDGVRFYRIQLASDAAFAHLLLDEDRLPECRAAVAQVPPGAYFWRVASVRELPGGALDAGPFAKAQPVVVGQAPVKPDAASLLSDEDSNAAGARLYWAAEPGQTFQLQVSANADFNHPLVDTHLAQPSWSSTELAPGVYNVRIQVIDPSGLRSTFSNARSFRVHSAVRSGTGLPVTSSDGQPLTRP